MPTPLVSILLPTYEPDPSYMKEAIASVQAQTYPHWTLTIRDDASNTDVAEMVRPFLKDSRITFHRNEQRRGIGGNWNACLREARGDIIAFLFQDDVWDPVYLAQGVEVFTRERNLGMVATAHAYRGDGSPEAERFLREAGYEAIQEARRRHLPRGTEEGTSFLRRWLRMGLSPNLVGEPSFVLLHRSVTDRVGMFRQDLPQGLDIEYWIRALLVTDLYAIPHESGIFRVHPQSASMRNDAAAAGLFDRLRCFETLLKIASTDLQKDARTAIIHQLSLMKMKFMDRVRGGKKTGGAGIIHFLLFALRHPGLTLRACVGM